MLALLSTGLANHSKSLMIPFLDSGASHRRKGGAETNLPLLHIALHLIILLYQIIQDLLQTITVCLECRYYIGHCTLDQNAVDHTEAFALGGEGFEGL
jgi:hypothetical protein